MHIKNSEEPIGTEIDCGIHGIHPDRYRTIIRKTGADEWAVVKFMFKTRKEESGRRGTLKEIVHYLNLRYGTKDTTED